MYVCTYIYIYIYIYICIPAGAREPLPGVRPPTVHAPFLINPSIHPPTHPPIHPSIPRPASLSELPLPPDVSAF